jgi:archaellum component FlaC
MKYQKSKEEFVQECNSLLKRIEDNIDNLSQFVKSKKEDASKEITEELNELKLHRKKIQDAISEASADASRSWDSFKKEMINTFKEAENKINKANPALTDTGLEDLPTGTYKESLATHSAVKA